LINGSREHTAEQAPLGDVAEFKKQTTGVVLLKRGLPQVFGYELSSDGAAHTVFE
jgi:hypothetical protein